MLFALAFVQVASAYTYIRSSLTNNPVKWHPSSVTFHVEVGTTPTSADGTYNGAVLAAIGIWNSNLSAVQLLGLVDAQPPGDGDNVNTIVMASDVYGTAFDDTTLAITTSWSYAFNNSRSEADIIFNNFTVHGTSFSWGSYRGARTSNQLDMRRVALHELGHALGLNHPDQAGQSVTAIMNSVISDLDTLAADDTTGAAHLYGIPGAAAPANNNFANATLITLSDGTANVGSNVYTNLANREGGEPNIVNNQGGHSVWWKWVAPSSGSVTIDTRGSSIDTIMGVYTGSAVSGLSLVIENDDEFVTAPGDFNSHTSVVTFSAVVGTTYYIAVDGWFDGYPQTAVYHIAGDVGDIVVHVTQAPTSVAPTITNPSNTTVPAAFTAQFSVTATGNPGPTLQWQRQPAAGGGFSNLSNGGTYYNVTTTALSIGGLGTTQGNNGDQFRCVATNSAGTATSLAATLTVLPFVLPTITAQPQPVAVTEGSNTSYSVTATSPTSLSYAWQASNDNGTTFTALTDFFTGISGSATTTLHFTNIQYALWNGWYFRCVVTNLSGSVNSNSVQMVVTLPPAVVQLSAGKMHSEWINTVSELYGTGGNSSGQLGTGNTTSTTLPLIAHLPGWNQFPIFTTAAFVAAGSEHTQILDTTGNLWVTGLNDHGQLGTGNRTAGSTPANTGINVAGMASGKWHSVRLLTDGTLYTVGANDSGQLGNGDTSGADLLNPIVQIATNVVDVAAGTRQTLFVKTDGTLWGTGDLYNNGTLVYTPIQIMTGVKTVAAGAYHSLILKTDGTLWTMGYDFFGQLGDGANATRTTPVQIATNVKAIAAGPFHSAYIKTDGSLWAFGKNDNGQVGDGSGANRNVPVHIRDSVSVVAGGESHTVFTLTDGSLWAMGLNTSGQFGVASPTSSLSPVRIIGGQLVAPSVPSNVQAAGSVANDRMIVTWAGNATALGYEVWRSTTNNFGTATRIAQNLRWPFYHDLTAAAATTYYYWITAINSTGTSSPSTGISGYFSPPVAPAFTTQPVAQSVNSGSSASFTVVATGYPAPAFQWQRLPAGTGTWVNVNDGGNYATFGSGGTFGLTVSNTSLGMNGDFFRCVASNSGGSLNSNGVLLTVVTGPAAPAITTDPQPVTVVYGSLTSFTVVATGAATLSYQWQILAPWNINWESPYPLFFSGSTTATLQVDTGAGIPPGLNGFLVRCVVSNAVGNATSATALLTVTQSPSIQIHPDNMQVTAGATVIFYGGANGAPAPTYQWQRMAFGSGTWVSLSDGGNYSGTTTSQLTITGAAAFMNGDQFRFVATNSTGTITSNPAVLTVIGGTANDFNGDGKSDILWENSVTGDRAIWLMNGATFLSGGVLGTIPLEWKIAAVADFNGDGKADILWENTATGEHSMWMMNGTAFLSGGYLGIIPTDWHVACVGDLNGDGKADLVWENTVTGDRAVWLMNGASFVSGGSLGNLSTDWKFTRSADFNGDGKADLLLENTVTGDRVIWLMNGATFLSGGLVATLPSQWKIVGTADFNSDGKADIVWENTATGDHSIWLMNGATFVLGASLGTIPTAWSVAGTGDYNGDGKSDVIWSNTVTGDRSIWLMNGTGFLAGGYLGVVSTDWRIGK